MNNNRYPRRGHPGVRTGAVLVAGSAALFGLGKGVDAAVSAIRGPSLTQRVLAPYETGRQKPQVFGAILEGLPGTKVRTSPTEFAPDQNDANTNNNVSQQITDGEVLLIKHPLVVSVRSSQGFNANGVQESVWYGFKLDGSSDWRWIDGTALTEEDNPAIPSGNYVNIYVDGKIDNRQDLNNPNPSEIFSANWDQATDGVTNGGENDAVATILTTSQAAQYLKTNS